MRALMTGLLAAAFANVAAAATLEVTPATLPAALSAAQAAGGGLLVLKAGEYPTLTLKGRHLALQCEPGARIAGLFLNGADYADILGCDVTAGARGVIYAQNSKGLIIQSVTLHGDPGLPDIVFRHAGGKVWLSTLQGGLDGVQLIDADKVWIYRNDISGVVGDGIQGASATNVRIEKNTFHDFAPYDGGHHQDCMGQFWSVAGHVQSANVVVTANTCAANAQGVDDFGGDPRGVANYVITFNDITTTMPQAFALTKSTGRVEHNHAHTPAGSKYRANVNITSPGATHCGNTSDATPWLRKPAWSDGPCPVAQAGGATPVQP